MTNNLEKNCIFVCRKKKFPHPLQFKRNSFKRKQQQKHCFFLSVFLVFAVLADSINHFIGSVEKESQKAENTEKQK